MAGHDLNCEVLRNVAFENMSLVLEVFSDDANADAVADAV